MRSNVTRILESRKIPYTLHPLPSQEKYSALQAAEILRIPPTQVFKTLVALRKDNGKPVLALVSALDELDPKALATALGVKKITMATQRQAEEITGLQAGGISPLALLHKSFQIVLDDRCQTYETITISAGRLGWNISLAPQHLLKLTGGTMSSIAR